MRSSGVDIGGEARFEPRVHRVAADHDVRDAEAAQRPQPYGQLAGTGASFAANDLAASNFTVPPKVAQ